jgi:signal transduction histidine kinase/ligand-binding sensor domain-containing protein/CheY-like chemotaxis protein/AraC-like DNA-binding protein
MWFGTYDGLNRYDGYSFKILRNVIGDASSLRDNHIYAIEEDGHYNLWVGCAKGLSIFNPATSRFSDPQILLWNSHSTQTMNEGVTVIRSVDKGKYILAGTQERGLLFFENNSQTGIQIPLPELTGKETSYSVNSIEIDSAGAQAWVFVQQVGLYRFDFKTKKLQAVNTSLKYSDGLKLVSKDTLWLATTSGLYLYDIKNRGFSSTIIPFKHRIASLFQDKKKTLWIASDGGGVWFLPAGSKEPLPFVSKDGTPLVNSNAIYAIYEDANERKWIGTLRGGINLIHPKTNSFRSITYTAPGERNNLVNDFILSFAEDQNNNVWIGTDGAGLRYWDRNKNEFFQYVHAPADRKTISSNFITGILKDDQNDVWISTWFGGVNRLRNSSKAFEHFRCIDPVTNQEENNAWLMYQDKMKRLWTSTTNNGTLYLFNRDRNSFELFDPGIKNIQCVAEDQEGGFWGGNYTSLIKIDRNKKQHQFYTIGYPVRSIHEDKNKNFWIGTEGGGLLLFDRATGTYKRFSTADGLPNNTILRILEDDKGNLWLSTYNGLSKFDPLKKIYRNFSQSDGLQSNQFSFNAGLVLKSGEFLFGGIKGFNIFYPDSIYDRKEMPDIFITNLKIDNVSIEEDSSYLTRRTFEIPEEVRVPYNKAILSLDFIALEYTGADKIKYAYYLEGWDKNWNYVNNIRTANYSKLQEGNYVFKIKATNGDGVWSNETRLLKIVVLPPWYRAWWAWVLYAVLFLTAIYLYIQYNKRQERLRYEIKLAHLENEKEKELTERKISFFTHISHEFRTPLTLIINPLKELLSPKGHGNGQDRKDISMIYRNARRLLSLVDQLLLFRKVESIDQQMQVERFDIVEICNEVFLSFGQHALSRNIDFSFDRNDHEIFIYADKEKIEIILFNVVANAFKYTGNGGHIQLTIEENAGSVEIIVRDTGCGIPADVGTKLFESFYQANNKEKASQTGFGIGLYVSQKLAIAHQGKLSYTSEQGSGTQFRLLLLKGRAHFPSQLISEDHKAGHTILHELVEEPLTENFSEEQGPLRAASSEVIDKLTSELPVLVIVDDNAEIRSYIRRIFTDTFIIYEADDGETGFELVVKQAPDIVISDIMMKNVTGIELCQKIKDTPAVAHTPVILLTASSSDEIKLKGIEGGAEDYITKPFDTEIIMARVRNILKGKNRLQQYFFNALTLKPNFNIPGEHKEFIEKCIEIVERHLDDPGFTIPTFCREIGMSHPSLYKKVKSVSGLTVNVFVRYLRLGKAAELLINTDKTIVEVTYVTGFNDIRYFREQFFKLFEMNPSDFVKRYRKVLSLRK